MEMRIDVTERGGPRGTAKELRQARKHAMRDVAGVWHRRTLPKHFEASAVNRYGYQKRSEKYAIRKARQKHHGRPLVWSGDLYRQVRREATVSSTSKGAVVKMRGPRYLYAYHKDADQPHKAEEMTATTVGELRTMERLIDRKMTRRLNEVKTVERRKLS